LEDSLLITKVANYDFIRRIIIDDLTKANGLTTSLLLTYYNYYNSYYF
jgi:hypothetical protein